MTADELRELRAWRSRQVLATGVLVLIVLPLVALSVAGAISDPERLFRSPLLLTIPLGLIWLWILGQAPKRWLRAREDERQGDIRSLRGETVLTTRRGIGFWAPSRHELRIRGECFEIGDFWADQIIPGKTYTVRYAPRSRAVLSVERQERPVERIEEGEDLGLDRRDRDLLRLIAQGLTDKEIARELNLSPATVRTYNSDLYAKLGISRRTQAVPIAEKLGLTSAN